MSCENEVPRLPQLKNYINKLRGGSDEMARPIKRPADPPSFFEWEGDEDVRYTAREIHLERRFYVVYEVIDECVKYATYLTVVSVLCIILISLKSLREYFLPK